MGTVDLLSREGEIAIAKRIEAGKDVMINALTQSPIIGKKIFEWKEQIEWPTIIHELGLNVRDFLSNLRGVQLPRVDLRAKCGENQW